MDAAETIRVKRKYDKASYTYDIMELPLEKLFFGSWRARASRYLHGKTLEVGTGTGKNVKYYPENTSVVAIDISEKMLRKAARRARKLGLDVKFAVMDAQNLAFREGVFSSTLSTFVFCSVPDPVQGISELARVSRPDGTMVFLEHVRSSNRLLATMMDLINPFIRWLTGVNINRDTNRNIQKGGATLVRENAFLAAIFRFLVAKPTHNTLGIEENGNTDT
jgi:ubiquinone/menaquinone biosynthesis C-methylase UbiE